VEAQKNLQLLARILPRVSLSLDRTQITFVGYEDQAVIPDSAGPLTVIAKGRVQACQPMTLSVRADFDLAGSQGRIPIQQVQWTYQGQGSGRGVLNRAGNQPVVLWNASGAHRGELQFVLNNNTHAAAGDYTGAVTLTLTSP